MLSPYLIMRLRTRYPKNGFKGDVAKEFNNLHHGPMTDYVILEKVIEYICPTDLLQLRLVCSLWDFEICRKLSKNPRIVIKPKNPIDLLKKGHRCPKPFAFNKFQIKLLQLNVHHLQLFSYPLLQESIHILKLTTQSNAMNIILGLLPQFRSMEHLTLICMPEDSLESIFTTRSFPLGISPMGANNPPVEKFPSNLKTLVLKNGNPFKMIFHNFSASLTSCLKSQRGTLFHLEFFNWSGSLVKILKESKVSNNLQVLIIKGRTLGDNDVQMMSSMNWTKLQRINIKVDFAIGEDVIEDFKSCLNPDILKECQIKV